MQITLNSFAPNQNPKLIIWKKSQLLKKFDFKKKVLKNIFQH
jgi:hypothetical protein